ncbi:MAG: hypothetical protein ILP17_06990 [Lachnospiraceae bacterium]|nr:hypothetical protein [Lachnospiraceae bacterium]
MIKGVVITIALELLLPVIAGLYFAVRGSEDSDPKTLFLARAYTSGQILLFALFQPVFVFAILKKMLFSRALMVYFPVCGAVVLALLTVTVLKYRTQMVRVMKSPFCRIGFWGIAAIACIAFMIVMSFFRTYMDGDDAFYVAVATGTASSDAMYVVEPYTGGAIISPFRYLFAPFPMWITFLSRASGIRAVAMAHTFFPWSMILLSFSVMYILACEMYGRDHARRDVFMFFGSVLTAFGDYSIYSAENFLLARSRQGKAALATFVLPFMLVLLISLIKKTGKGKKITLTDGSLLMLAGFAGALCSTMGGMLCMALVGVCAICMSVMYRKLRTPLLMILCTMPCMVFVAMYLVMR